MRISDWSSDVCSSDLRVGPVPCTTAARALLDAAPEVPTEVLAELVDEVPFRPLAPASRVLGTIRRAGHGRGRAGAPAPQIAKAESWEIGCEDVYVSVCAGSVK